MDKILANFAEPEWWVTGLFFSILLKYTPIIFFHAKSILGNSARSYLRKRKLIHAKFIKTNRHNLAAINHQSAKSQAYFVMFLLVCSLYLVWYAAGPLFQIQNANFFIFIVCTTPMYIVEILWLIQNDRAVDLVAGYEKVRVTNSLSRSLRSLGRAKSTRAP
jgi:hypothetical protein